VNGKKRMATLTWTPPEGMSEKRAEKESRRVAFQFEEECRGGANTSAIKFGAFLDQWFAEYAAIKLKQQTVMSYRWLARRIREELGHIRLDKLTMRDIQKFVGKLAVTPCENNRGATLSAKTIKDYVAVISSVCEYARKMQLITKNPCEGVTIPRDERKERDMLSLADTQELLVEIETEVGDNRQCALFITLAIYTGMRRGELLGLEWRDVDFTHGLLSVKRAMYYAKGRGAYLDTPKTKSSLRTLKLSGAVMSKLTEYRKWQIEYAVSLGDKWQEGGRVFTNWCGEPMYTNAPERYFKATCKKLGIPIVCLHSLRHLNASLLISAGLDVKTVQANLGHSSATTTLDIYAHEFQTAAALASAAVSDALERKIAQ
jgi:integrase